MSNPCPKCGGFGLVVHEREVWEQPHPCGGFYATETQEDWCPCHAGEAAQFEHETRYAA